MSKMGQDVIQREQDGELLYVEGRGYVDSDLYASEYMKTTQFENDLDKVFGNPKEQIDDFIKSVRGE